MNPPLLLERAVELPLPQPQSPLDVVYMVRAGAVWEELRYSLRSVTQNLPHRKVWLFGATVPWAVNVNQVHVPQVGASIDGYKFINTQMNMEAMAREEGLTEQFHLFHDDMFVLRPMFGIPDFRRRESWEEWVEHCRAATAKGSQTWRLARAVETAEILRYLGYEVKHSFELHVPIRVCRTALVEAVAGLASIRREGLQCVQKRTFVATMMGMVGAPRDDVKINDESPIPRGADFVSTSDASFPYMRVGKQLRNLFPHPSVYEWPTP